MVRGASSLPLVSLPLSLYRSHLCSLPSYVFSFSLWFRTYISYLIFWMILSVYFGWFYMLDGIWIVGYSLISLDDFPDCGYMHVGSIHGFVLLDCWSWENLKWLLELNWSVNIWKCFQNLLFFRICSFLWGDSAKKKINLFFFFTMKREKYIFLIKT